MIRFQLLGEIAVRRLDGTTIDQLLRQPKRLALLAYLAAPAPGSWHRRDTLLALFWPELDAAHARTSLRNALYMLRQSVGESVIRTRGDEEVSLDPGLVATDLARLTLALTERRHGEALAAYAGELLPGLYPPESDGFLRWLDGERDRLRVQVVDAGLQFAAELQRGGQLAQCRTTLRRVLQIHPDEETAVRALMAASHAMGDRAGALGAFEEHRARLAREYEAEPAPETAALAMRIRQAKGNPDRPEPLTLEAEQAGAPAMQDPVVPRRRQTDGAMTPARGERSHMARAAALAILIVAGVAVAAVAWNGLQSPSPPAIGRSTPVTTKEGLQIEPAISPNGRLVAYASGNPDQMQIVVTRLDGSTSWPLSNDSTPIELMPRWSPDNDALAFLSRTNAYVAPAIGGAPRLVAEGGRDEASVRSASWSPQGDSLAIVRHDSLFVIPLEGPGYRMVGTGSQIHSCVWSPDGNWIACVAGNWLALQPGPLFGNQAPSAIVIFPATGGDAIPVTSHDNANFSPAWSGDGRQLWFLSNRDGVWGETYLTRIGRNGRPGPIERVGLRAEAISLAKGRVAYSSYSRRANIWEVPIPEAGLATLRGATQETAGNQIVEVVRTSRDGRWLVYDSNIRGNADIYRLATAGGRPERITDDPRDEYAADLSPDGRQVAYHLWSEGSRLLHVRSLQTGTAGEAIPGAAEMGVPRWSPDGSAIAAWDHRTEPGAVLVIRRSATGTWLPPAWRLEQAQLPAWSPDGKRIAFIVPPGSIRLIPSDSGTVRSLYEPRPGTDDPLASFLAWDPGRPDLYFRGSRPDGSAGIWAVPLQGGRPHLLVDLRDKEGRTTGPSLASDGTRFYFTLEERLGNVQWAALAAH